MKYSLDTSVIIDAWRRYPIYNFPAVWKKLESLARDGQIKISVVVMAEIKESYGTKHDVRQWFKERESIFIRKLDDAFQQETKRLINTYNNFGLSTGKNEADPYVVALAIIEDCDVVTHEKPSNDMNGPKIPDICREEEITYISFTDIIVNENWVIG